MNEIKAWYLSRTVWASIVTVCAAVAGLAGVTLGVADQVILAETILQLVTAIAGIVAILGRLSARSRIR